MLTIALGQRVVPRAAGLEGGRAFYGDRLGVIAELEIGFEDGHRQRVVTDESWTAGRSDVLANDLYDGQTIDARRLHCGLVQPGAKPEGIAPVRELEFDTSRLPYLGPPVTRHEALKPVQVWQSPSGRTLVDFGQNLVGWMRFTVSGPAGAEIRIRHAEVLEHGELGVRPLRTRKATDRFVLSGGEDVFEPTMTFHGFRYAEVTGWPGEISGD